MKAKIQARLAERRALAPVLEIAEIDSRRAERLGYEPITLWSVTMARCGDTKAVMAPSVAEVIESFDGADDKRANRSIAKIYRRIAKILGATEGRFPVTEHTYIKAFDRAAEAHNEYEALELYAQNLNGVIKAFGLKVGPRRSEPASKKYAKPVTPEQREKNRAQAFADPCLRQRLESLGIDLTDAAFGSLWRHSRRFCVLREVSV